jgi:hypothetical protein
LVLYLHVEKACVGVDESVHIVETGRGDKAVPKEKEQVGSGELRIADDKKTVGWLAGYENCCPSDSIPLELMIEDWRRGTRAAFSSGTMRGDSVTASCTTPAAAAAGGLWIHSTDTLYNDSPKWTAGMRN